MPTSPIIVSALVDGFEFFILCGAFELTTSTQNPFLQSWYLNLTSNFNPRPNLLFRHLHEKEIDSNVCISQCVDDSFSPKILMFTAQ